MSLSREIKWLVIVVVAVVLLMLVPFLLFGIGSDSGVDLGENTL